MELGIALIRKACVLIKESSRCDQVDRKKKRKKEIAVRGQNPGVLLL